MLRGLRRALPLLATLVVLVPTGAHATSETIAPPFEAAYEYEYAPSPALLNRYSSSASADVTTAGVIRLASAVENKIGSSAFVYNQAAAEAAGNLVFAHEPGTATAAEYRFTIRLNSVEVLRNAKPFDLAGFAIAEVGFWVDCFSCGWGVDANLYWPDGTSITDETLTVTLFVDGFGEQIGAIGVQLSSYTSVGGGVRAGSASASLDADVLSVEAAY